MYRGQVKDVSMYRGSLCPLWSPWSLSTRDKLEKYGPLSLEERLSSSQRCITQYSREVWTFWSLSEVHCTTI